MMRCDLQVVVLLATIAVALTTSSPWLEDLSQEVSALFGAKLGELQIIGMQILWPVQSCSTSKRLRNMPLIILSSASHSCMNLGMGYPLSFTFFVVSHS